VVLTWDFGDTASAAQEQVEVRAAPHSPREKRSKAVVPAALRQDILALVGIAERVYHIAQGKKRPDGTRERPIVGGMVAETCARVRKALEAK
jgi:hypothetical protein